MPDELIDAHNTPPNASDLKSLARGPLQKRNIRVTSDKGSVWKIPDAGRLIILANDPLPGLSALALLQFVAQIRSDVKLLTNTQHDELKDVAPYLIPTHDTSLATKSATQHLIDDGVLIIQPLHYGKASGVPRPRQERWSNRFLSLAEHTLSPILHIYVGSDEQPLMQHLRILYRGENAWRQFAQKMLPKHSSIRLSVGDQIDPSSYKELELRQKVKAKLLRKELYRVADGKSSFFKTMPAIAPPQAREALISELASAERLGKTKDGKLIYLCRVTSSGSSLLLEIGRLREKAFRLIGEGSGTPCDIDDFDLDYEHIVLWDEQDDEVVGAYRLREAFPDSHPVLYTSTLFSYNEHSSEILNRGIELGRSFVQPKYWGSRSLDYLWTGIAAYIRQRPRVRYLLGAVSISNAYSQQAKDLLVGYYSKFYSADLPMVVCRKPYILGSSAIEQTRDLFAGLDAKTAFVALREQLTIMGHAVPTLYKQYTELCEPGGALFHGFNIDPDFQDCIDGMVVVDLEQLRPLKRRRYGLDEHDFLAYDMERSDSE